MSYEEDDRELEELLGKKLKAGELVEFLVAILSGKAEDPEIVVNGTAIALKSNDPPISDKSCYKQCLKDSLGKADPDAFYKACAKKCTPKTTFTVGIAIQ